MQRRWRVRHSYPRPVVDLVQLLLTFRGVREISGLLDIPASVIYRWRAGKRPSSPPADRWSTDAEAIALLVELSSEIGSLFMQRLHAANGPAWRSIRAARTALEERGHDDKDSARDGGGVEEAAPRGDVTTRAPVVQASAASARDLLEQPGWSCGGGGPHYVFDARKERSSRRVRQRLEAARRIVDTEYFLDIDCKMLADTAQMSRHHFIRMFNQVFGSTPHQYLIRARVEAAKRLLIASREPIEVIAAGVGFRSGQSLNRAFKQVEGQSVSRFCQTARDKARDSARSVARPAPIGPDGAAMR
jgi:AraC-like DNA-binding protein